MPFRATFENGQIKIEAVFSRGRFWYSSDHELLGAEQELRYVASTKKKALAVLLARTEDSLDDVLEQVGKLKRRVRKVRRQLQELE